MEDFKEQYRQELIYQEIKSNRHTVKGFVWFLIAVGVIWLFTVTGFFLVDKVHVTIAFAVTFILFIPVFAVYWKGDLSKPWLKYFFLTLICIVSAVIMSFLTFHAVLLCVIPLLFAIQYRRRSTIWFVYVVNTVTMLISSLIGFYYGLCDLNILLESNHARNWYMEMVAEGTWNFPFNENPLFIILVFEVFPRSIILFVFSIMMQYAAINGNEDAHRIAQLTYLKEMDTGTRVFNKNKYEEMAEKYYPRIDQVGVAFWDLNNLKYINDKYGHAMGDKAIEKLSFFLNNHADSRCRIYRVGGDEFLMVIDNPKHEEVENIVKSIEQNLKEDHAENEIKISSAVGVAYGEGRDILKVVEVADAKMYKNKKLGKAGRKFTENE